MSPHEPEAMTIGSGLAERTSIVCRAMARASSRTPELNAGWPQQVWPSGQRDLDAEPLEHAHDGHARVREELVDQARDEELDAARRAIVARVTHAIAGSLVGASGASCSAEQNEAIAISARPDASCG